MTVIPLIVVALILMTQPAVWKLAVRLRRRRRPAATPQAVVAAIIGPNMGETIAERGVGRPAMVAIAQRYPDGSR